jgi:hypothetical protein
VGRKPAERLQTLATACEKPAGAVGLRLERREPGVHRLGLETLSFESEPDRSVAVAPPRERLRPRHGDTLVVDEPHPLQRLERLGPRPGGSAPAGQTGLEVPAGHVPIAKRSRRHAECVRTAQLTPERAGGLAIERAPHPQVRAHDRVCGNGAPRCAVEIDLNAPARPLP